MKVFKLFASCIPVKGAKRFVLCDLQRSEIFFIPEGIYQVLTDYENIPIEEIKSLHNHELDDVIDYHIDFLLKNELGFLTENPENFPKINLEWESPEWISNAIVESDKDSKHNFIEIFTQLEKLGCKFLELRFYNEVTIQDLERILDLTNDMKFRSINLILKYDTNFRNWDTSLFQIRFQRVGQILIHSYPNEGGIAFKGDRFGTIEKSISDNECCGQVSSKYFNLNMKMFIESHHYNSCLNKKISITASGEIKNCPSTLKSFGNVASKKLDEVVFDELFNKLGKITKDQVDVCRDCEFRYICQDCRAHIKDASNIYSKPKKCNYDPYTATWRNTL